MNLIKISLLATAFLAFAQARADEVCHWEVDQNSVQIDWTAFKTNQKVPVNGSFTEVTFFGDLDHGKSLPELLGDLEAEISINSSQKIHTGNPGRDQTLFQKFFKFFSKKALLKGAVKKVKGTASAGTFYLDLEMNQKMLAVPMKYTRNDEGVFVASGQIDLTDFGLDGPLKKLNKACEALHRGADGVSKTWSTVEIKLQANILEKCVP
jgi:polyisoprenoid-binding protein YceI